MADERLELGRHELMNGHRALRLGYVDDGERFFQAALLRFRSPDLRLGEAHSLRGLAEVSLTVGELEAAEGWARQALEAYLRLPDLLATFDTIDSANAETLDAVRTGALEGEVASLALLGEILTRRGDLEGARQASERAEARFGEVSENVTGAGVFMAHGHLVRRQGRIDEAIQAFEQAASIHRSAGQHDGVAIANLILAEVHGGRGAVEAAYHALHAALEAARELEQPGLEARVLCALGEIALQARHDVEAASYFEDAIPKAKAAGDLEREGQALVGKGCAAGHMGDPSAIGTMFAGIRVLVRSPRQLGLAGALLRLGNRARRVSAPRLALAASEISRRMYEGTDPVVGHGQAMRTQVKALAQLQVQRATLMAAIVRKRVSGEVQPNAVAVADWYSERAPDDIVAEIEARPLDELRATVRETVEEMLAPDLGLASLEADALADPDASLALLEHLVEEFSMGRGPTRLAVQSTPSRRLDPPTEVPMDERDDDSDSGEPAEVTDVGGYQSLDDMYGSLYES